MKNIISLCLSLLLILAMSYFAWSMAIQVRRDNDMSRARTHQEGRDDFKAGIPASANPEKDSSCRRAWLDGWIEASREEETMRKLNSFKDQGRSDDI